MAVAVSKKKKEEENLKALRELTALEHNKKCLECHQRGITYVDMTTNGFVCVQCSGYLRGLNPPHRVKSISMTTFSEAEIKQLKEGGNEVAKKTWSGKWNPKKDREPDKKNEVAFKEYLISKYERKTWYRSPEEVKKEEQQATPTEDQTKVSTPTTSVKSVERPRASAHPIPVVSPPPSSSSPAPQPTTAPSTASATVDSKPKVDLLGELEGDPFASKPPVGGVSVLPSLPMMGVGGGSPLFSTSQPKQGEFGAFIGSTPSSAPSLLQPSTGQPTSTAALSSSASDKYAALASLDETLRELKVKDEPQQQPFGGGPVIGPGGGGGPVIGPGGSGPVIGPGGGGGGGFGPGVTNPFGAPAGQVTQQQSNPFSGGGGQSAFGMGMQQQGSGFGVPPQQQQTQMGGAQFGQQMGGAGSFGTGVPSQQQFGGFGQQPVQRPGVQQWGQQASQQSFGGGGGGFGGGAQQMAATQQMQWRGQQQQPGMMGGAQQMGGVQQMGVGGIQQQWGAQPQQHSGGGAQWGGASAQVQGQQMGGGMQGFGSFAGAQSPPSQHNQFGGFAAGTQQQPQQQFGGFGGGQQQQKMGGAGGFNWGATSSSSGFPQTGGAGSPMTSRSLDSTKLQQTSQSSGWSSGLTKPAPAPSNSSWGQQPQMSSASATSGMGWSSGMTTGMASAGSGWGNMTSQSGGGVSGAGSWGGSTGGGGGMAAGGGGWGSTGSGGFGQQQQQMGGAVGGQTGWGTFQQPQQPAQQVGGFMGGGVLQPQQQQNPSQAGAPNPFASGSQTTNPFL